MKEAAEYTIRYKQLGGRNTWCYDECRIVERESKVAGEQWLKTREDNNPRDLFVDKCREAKWIESLSHEKKE